MDLSTSLLDNEGDIRFYLFVSVFLFIALWETYAPRIRDMHAIAARWFNNIGLLVVSNLLIAVVYPAAAVSASIAVQARGWGLFNHVTLPWWFMGATSLVAIDLSRYGEHVVLHKVPFLWRFHKVHHSDLEYDCTTGLRFHPIEALLTSAMGLSLIALLGMPPLAVLFYELCYISITLFSHGNIRMPAKLDHFLRYVLVTPDAHRIHHSALRQETDSNYGILLLWWDRLFRTYRVSPQRSYEAMTMGLPEVRDPKAVGLAKLLLMPFAGLKIKD